jgi:signal transduction histidine kinase
VHGSWRDSNLNSFIGAVVTPALVALVPSYLGSVLRELDVARQDAVEALADSDLLFRIARAFLQGGRSLDDALPRVVTSAVDSSRLDAVAIFVPDDSGEVRAYGLDGLGEHDASASDDAARLEPADLAEAFGDEGVRTVPQRLLPDALEARFAPYEWIGVAPLRSSDGVEGWLLAATHERPMEISREMLLLETMAGQVALGVRNVRLAERIGELAAEAERTRIAREIHDGIAQMVFMLTLSLETAIDRVGGDPDEQRRRLRDLTALAKNALWEVRQYIFDLRPLLSGDEGLTGAVQGQVKEFQAVSELPVELSIHGSAPRLPVATSAALYRIVQEGLGNIFRHARASRVSIALEFDETQVHLSIADDGVGIDEAAAGSRTGHGMENLRRRVEEMQGTLDVRGESGAGTCIEVTVPVGRSE